MGHEVTMLFNQGLAAHTQDIQIAAKFNLQCIKPQFLRDLFFYSIAILHCLRKRQRPDVIHVHGDWSAFFFGLFVANLLRPSICVASIHSEIRAGIRRRFYRSALARYDSVYCTGSREAGLLQSLGVAHAHWQPSGVSSEFYEVEKKVLRGPTELDVICIANLVPVKNLELLIKVAQRLPNYRFEVVGDGPLLEHLTTTCATLGVENVHFVGRLNRLALATRLSCARIFYLPSFSEGTPTAMMEAMTMGLPVVLTPSNDYQGMIREGVNGYVTPDFTVESSVQAINQLLSNPLLMSKMSHQNRVAAELFTWPAVAERISSWMNGYVTT
jgi:glycosyltransferase involved in cell wall biosynthesis